MATAGQEEIASDERPRVWVTAFCRSAGLVAMRAAGGRKIGNAYLRWAFAEVAGVAHRELPEDAGLAR